MRTSFALAVPLAVLATAPLFLPGCGGEEAPPPAPPEVLSVKTLEIGAGGSEGTRQYSGSLAAWQHSEMAFEVPGKIIEFRAVEGDRIPEGFVLARLDPRDYQSNLIAAKANLAQAKADFQRFTTLLEKGVAPKADYDAKKMRFEVSEAELEKAEKAVEDTQLVAPFAGVMARKLVEDFDNVLAKQPVLILQDDTRFKIRVTVPEQDMAGGQRETDDLGEISEILQPRVLVTSLPDQVFDAELYELSLTADPVTRTFDATFVMDRPKRQVLPGMTATVTIDVPNRAGAASGHRVPGVAVWSDQAGQSYVWKVDPATNTVSRASVTLGNLSGGEVEIVAGLAPGDVIATSGIQSLSDGAKVRPLGARLR